MIGRLDAFFVGAKSVEGGIVEANVVDVVLFRDAVFHFQCPVAGVDEETAEVFAAQVNGSTHSGAEDAVDVTGLASVSPGPSKGHEGCFQFDWVGGFHAGQSGSIEENLSRGFEVAYTVNVRSSEDVGDAFEDGMILVHAVQGRGWLLFYDGRDD